MTYVPATAPLSGLTTWDEWQAGLRALFAGLLGLEVAAVAFARQPRGQIRGPRAQLDILSVLHEGVEDMRRTLVGAELVEESLGHRVMILQVAVWGERQSLGSSPRALLERMRSRLRWTSTVEALRALQLGLELAEQPVEFTSPQDGRRLTVASIDLRLSFSWVEADTDNPLGWFDKAEIVAEFNDPVGADLSAPDLSPQTIAVDTSTP